MKSYILFNPMAANGKCRSKLEESNKFTDSEYIDMTTLKSYDEFFDTLGENDTVIIAGGDGTLNRFINDTENTEIKCRLLYFPAGTGNDFFTDEGEDGTVELNKYLNNLPTVKVNDKDYKFLNGIGYGIDGYCCEVGDELRKKSDKPVNYASIAIKGLLFSYKPTSAKITVDGVEHSFDNVWIAPTMNGRFYGGGMEPTPNQKRDDDSVSVMVYHSKSKLKALMIFPSIFKGEHIKHKDVVSVYEGRNISVEFNSPRALQIDGETIKNVLSYSVAK